MKKVLILLFALSVLFQSCYSYKTISKEKNNLANGKIYKIKQYNYFEKVKCISSNDSLFTIKSGGQVEQIPKSSIVEIKEREFSVGKTVLLSVFSIPFIVLVVNVLAIAKQAALITAPSSIVFY